MPRSTRNAPRTRVPAAQRKRDERQFHIEAEREATAARLESLAAENRRLRGLIEQAEAAIKSNEAAQHQMIGRLELLGELLGVDPVDQIPAPAEPVEGEPVET